MKTINYGVLRQPTMQYTQLINPEFRKASLAILATMMAAVLVFAALPLQAAGAAAPVIDRQDVTGDTEINPCNGEEVTFTRGVFQVVEHELVDGANGIHFIAEGNAQGVAGTGDFGGIYRATGGFWVEGLIRPGTTQVFPDVGVFNLIGRGSTPNAIFALIVIVTINANGDLIVDFELENAKCIG